MEFKSLYVLFEFSEFEKILPLLQRSKLSLGWNYISEKSDKQTTAVFLQLKN